jgi:RNA polymerase sigma-70 factor (ECF subfamily)
VSLFKKSIKSYSDEELMRSFIEEHRTEAIEEIYHRYADKLIGYFFKMFDGDEAKAKDFLHDLFVKVMERKSQYDPSRRFYTWVFTIASNMCKTDFRKPLLTKVSDSESALLKISFSDEKELDKLQFRKTMRTAMHQLDHHHKVTFILKHQQGCTLQEIADITETSLGTVKSRLFYATKIMSEKLKNHTPNASSTTYKTL